MVAGAHAPTLGSVARSVRAEITYPDGTGGADAFTDMKHAGVARELFAVIVRNLSGWRSGMESAFWDSSWDTRSAVSLNQRMLASGPSVCRSDATQKRLPASSALSRIWRSRGLVQRR